MRDLQSILDRWQADADALARNGEPDKARLLERCVDEVRTAAADWLRWVDEDDAMLRSGNSRDWWRREFTLLAPRGHARRVGRGKREYRLAIVPVRKTLLEAAQAGRRAAQAMQGAA